MPDTELVIEVLAHLAKAGPTSIRELAAHFKRSCWWMRLFLYWLHHWDWTRPERPYWRFPWRASLRFRLTNEGRRFLQLHDELDLRAPFAKFEP